MCTGHRHVLVAADNAKVVILSSHSSTDTECSANSNSNSSPIGQHLTVLLPTGSNIKSS